jgi:hypothetical protein
MGFGYHGDNKRIGTNQPLICTVTLRDFMSEVYKKQMDQTSITDVPAIKKAILDPKTSAESNKKHKTNPNTNKRHFKTVS